MSQFCDTIIKRNGGEEPICYKIGFFFFGELLQDWVRERNQVKYHRRGNVQILLLGWSGCISLMVTMRLIGILIACCHRCFGVVMVSPIYFYHGALQQLQSFDILSHPAFALSYQCQSPKDTVLLSKTNNVTV